MPHPRKYRTLGVDTQYKSEHLNENSNASIELFTLGASLWMAVVMLLFLAGTNRVSAGSLASYWGQNGNEGSLADVCSSRSYDILMISFLNVFGNGQTPALNLAGHCDPSSGGCQGLASDVQSCQTSGKKVILSLGGAVGSYGLSSTQDAQDVAQYLWDNFFGGSSASSPLGAVQLDGIDLDIEAGGSSYYSDLIATLRSLAQNYGKALFITAAPQCPFPDARLGPGDGTALSAGVDYVFVQFYNNPQCEYQGSSDQLVAAWNQWTSSLTSSQVFLGVPASDSTDTAGSGYIDPNTLVNTILPLIKTASNYGGVMLWNVYADEQTNYSTQIRGSV
ncbi:hypothetical protein R1sor_004120 [Riccia sorocarpa]|uniref:chitinase n=1 Tax=Riccia sorocarpa TaxID=122646 RepID=A0ABD3H3W8_9MARC